MKKAAVYTKTGDSGTTGLVGGTRIKKNDPRIHLYGEVDELNSFIGAALFDLKELRTKSTTVQNRDAYAREITFLESVQSSLFDLGSNLACELEQRKNFKLPQLDKGLIDTMEDHIDRMDSTLPPLKNFILPGGLRAACSFHLCRTICRRIERQLVDFNDHKPGEAPDFSIEYLNRLSDYFFILSRFVNHSEGMSEVDWHSKK